MTTDTLDNEARQRRYEAQRAAARALPKTTVEVQQAPEWCPHGGGELCCQGQCNGACVAACDAWAMGQRQGRKA